jgi:hypothetical protein
VTEHVFLLAFHYHQTHVSRGLGGLAGLGVIVGLLLMAKGDNNSGSTD